MATCKDCMNYGGCTSEWHKLSKVDIEHLCCNFKNKTDFVEVVRCKDCWKRYKHCFDKTLEDNDYCSYGERKTD